MYKAMYTIQLALYAQPDAKIANGIYWTGVWVRLFVWIWKG